MPKLALSPRLAGHLLAHPFLEWGTALGLVAGASEGHVGWRTAACALLAGASLGKSWMAARRTAAPAREGRETARAGRGGPENLRRKPRGAARPRGRLLFAGVDGELDAVAEELRGVGYALTFGDVRSPLAGEERAEPFDVIVFAAPGSDEDEVCSAVRALRRRRFAGPLLRLARTAPPDAAARFEAAGGDAYLDLRMEPALLAREVRHSLRRAREVIENADTIEGRFILPDSLVPLRSELADDADIADMLGDFICQLETRAAALSQAVVKHDMQTLRRTVLQLKGAAGGYGFPSITGQARQVEELLDRGAGDLELAQEVDALCSLCIRAGFAHDGGGAVGAVNRSSVSDRRADR